MANLMAPLFKKEMWLVLDTDIDQAPFSLLVMVDDWMMHALGYDGISFRLLELMARAKFMSTWVKWVKKKK